MISGHGTEKLLSIWFEILGLGNSEVSVLNSCRKMGCNCNLTLIYFYLKSYFSIFGFNQIDSHRISADVRLIQVYTKYRFIGKKIILENE